MIKYKFKHYQDKSSYFYYIKDFLSNGEQNDLIEYLDKMNNFQPCTNYRDKNSEIGIKWNDKDLNINWNIKSPILSKKDNKNLNFKEINF